MTEGAVAGTGLVDLIASLADNKLFLGRRYAEWSSSAPTLESAVAAAAMAQDEIGHARSLYPVLHDLVGDSPEAEPETRTEFTNVPFLNAPFEGWTDFVAANFLFDTALSVLLEAGRDSSYQPLAQRARRILEEERLHRLHAEGWTRRLAGKGPGVKEALSQSFRAVIPQTLEMFEIAEESLVREGALSSGAEELRRRYRERVNPVLGSAGLEQT